MNFNSRLNAPISFCHAAPLSVRRHNRRARRRGVSMYMFVLAFPMMVGVLGIVVDLGNLYTKRAQAQRAADAAAIAGAMEGSGGDMVGKAREYSGLNGYQDGVNEATVTVNADVGASVSQVRVRVERKEAVYFAPILEGFLKATGQAQTAAQFSRVVSAEGTARIRVSLPLGLGGPYGIADPARSPVNNSIYGPDAYYNFGDPYATRFLQDGVTPNPQYSPDGAHQYTMHITSDYLSKNTDVALQIFDPDGFIDTSSYDEIKPPNRNIQPAPTGPRQTTTVYEIYDPKGIKIAAATYGDDQSTNMKWVTPNGFTFTPTSAGKYTVKVRSTAGSDENGFQLRAGPSAGTSLDESAWNDTYGDKNGANLNNIAVPMDADDHIQLNFSRDGAVKFRLGYVDGKQAGKNISVTKFDVDVGSQSIVYTCDTLPGQTFSGTIPPNPDGVWSTDDIQLPTSYTGGNWYAEYIAARLDTSIWKLSGTGDGKGEVRLVK